MAKFIKSIFQSSATEKRKSLRHEGENEGENDSPISDRRKLSMSRSGRLKQAYKKRHSLSLELYGKDAEMQSTEKPKSKEYHVHTPAPEPQFDKQTRKSIDASTVSRTMTDGSKSPEEEIDNAFDIIDKS